LRAERALGVVSALLVPFGAALARELDVRAEPVPRLVLLARALRPELGVALAQAWLRGSRMCVGLRLLEDMCRRDRGNPWLWTINGYSLRDHGGADASVAPSAAPSTSTPRPSGPTTASPSPCFIRGSWTRPSPRNSA